MVFIPVLLVVPITSSWFGPVVPSPPLLATCPTFEVWGQPTQRTHGMFYDDKLLSDPALWLHRISLFYPRPLLCSPLPNRGETASPSNFSPSGSLARWTPLTFFFIYFPKSCGSRLLATFLSFPPLSRIMGPTPPPPLRRPTLFGATAHGVVFNFHFCQHQSPPE